jgi:hypothetical protein
MKNKILKEEYRTFKLKTNWISSETRYSVHGDGNSGDGSSGNGKCGG